MFRAANVWWREASNFQRALLVGWGPRGSVGVVGGGGDAVGGGLSSNFFIAFFGCSLENLSIREASRVGRFNRWRCMVGLISVAPDVVFIMFPGCSNGVTVGFDPGAELCRCDKKYVRARN